tara:strand:+ start:960 stop:1181 length:222 start_codon:yes stop_codon:yes gene_type:complete
MTEPIYVGYEIGYDKDGALDYFWQDERTEFFDKTKHQVRLTKYKEITDEEDKKLGMRDWVWQIEIFNKGDKND